jgi:hypothetical protein
LPPPSQPRSPVAPSGSAAPSAKISARPSANVWAATLGAELDLGTNPGGQTALAAHVLGE